MWKQRGVIHEVTVIPLPKMQEKECVIQKNVEDKNAPYTKIHYVQKLGIGTFVQLKEDWYLWCVKWEAMRDRAGIEDDLISSKPNQEI